MSRSPVTVARRDCAGFAPASYSACTSGHPMRTIIMDVVYALSVSNVNDRARFPQGFSISLLCRSCRCAACGVARTRKEGVGLAPRRQANPLFSCSLGWVAKSSDESDPSMVPGGHLDLDHRIYEDALRHRSKLRAYKEASSCKRLISTAMPATIKYTRSAARARR